MSATAKNDRLRTFCLSLPDALEVVLRRGPTYRIGGKVFALDRVVAGRPSAWFKPGEGTKAILLARGPGHLEGLL